MGACGRLWRWRWRQWQNYEEKLFSPSPPNEAVNVFLKIVLKVYIFTLACLDLVNTFQGTSLLTIYIRKSFVPLAAAVTHVSDLVVAALTEEVVQV